MTAWVTVSPRYASASRLSLPRIRAEISWALYFLPSMSTVQLVPMWRLTERTVRSGLVMAWRLATSPTRTSPVLEKPTTDGVVRPPSAFGMTTGSPASSTLTTELVVPKSIPTALAICSPSGRLRSDNYSKHECYHVNFSAHYMSVTCKLRKLPGKGGGDRPPPARIVPAGPRHGPMVGPGRLIRRPKFGGHDAEPPPAADEQRPPVTDPAQGGRS